MTAAPMTAVEDATDVHIAHYVDRCAASIEKPVHGKQQRNVARREMDRREDQRHRYKSCLWNPSGTNRRDDAGQDHHHLLCQG